MKRLFSVAVFVIASLAIIAGMILRNLDAEPQPVQAQAQGVMAVQATASPQPTATAQPTATGTPNATATAQAEELALLAWQAEIEARQAANKRAELDNLEREGQLLALYDWTPTAQARETAQAEATTQAQEAAEATATAQENSRIDNKIMMDAKAEQTSQDIRFVLWVAGVAVLFVLVVTVIRMLDYRAKTALFVAATGAATSNPLEHIAPVTDAPAALPAYPGGLDVRLFAAFLSPGTLRKAARLVLDGVPLTHDNYTPILTCMSEGQFTKLQNALVEYRAAEWVDETHKAGIALTEKGERFFADLLTTSPLNQYAPGTPSRPVKQPIDDGFTLLMEGGGQGKDEG